MFKTNEKDSSSVSLRLPPSPTGEGFFYTQKANKSPARGGARFTAFWQRQKPEPTIRRETTRKSLPPGGRGTACGGRSLRNFTFFSYLIAIAGLRFRVLPQSPSAPAFGPGRKHSLLPALAKNMPQAYFLNASRPPGETLIKSWKKEKIKKNRNFLVFITQLAIVICFILPLTGDICPNWA